MRLLKDEVIQRYTKESMHSFRNTALHRSILSASLSYLPFIWTFTKYKRYTTGARRMYSVKREVELEYQLNGMQTWMNKKASWA